MKPSPHIDIETEVVSEPQNPLAVAIANSGLELESAQSLNLAFSPLFEQAEEWRKKVAAINVTDASQVREMKLARESRLALREIRIKAEHTRKKLKEDSLRKGKAIDGVYNVLEYLIAPLEESLLYQEQFAARQEAARKQWLESTRKESLAPFGIDVSFYDLGNMPDESFAQLLENTKLAAQAKIEAAQKAEAERIAAEKLAAEQKAEAELARAKKEKADAAERERIRKENEKLKAEAVKRENAAKADRERAEQERKAAQAKADELARVAAEKAQKELAAVQLKAKQEREAMEAKAKKEREELAAKAKAEQDAREQAERELAATFAAGQKAIADKLAAEEAAQLAPDKDKIMAFAASVRALTIPTAATKKGETALADIVAKAESFAQWIEKKASAL